MKGEQLREVHGDGTDLGPGLFSHRHYCLGGSVEQVLVIVESNLESFTGTTAQANNVAGTTAHPFVSFLWVTCLASFVSSHLFV